MSSSFLGISFLSRENHLCFCFAILNIGDSLLRYYQPVLSAGQGGASFYLCRLYVERSVF